MIVGEAEIQGQVKRAYELALVENTTSAFMNRLFREALAAGKRVRTETSVGDGSVSVSSVAVQLAQETLGDLTGRRVVVIGAGETGELTARALTEPGRPRSSWRTVTTTARSGSRSDSAGRRSASTPCRRSWSAPTSCCPRRHRPTASWSATSSPP